MALKRSLRRASWPRSEPRYSRRRFDPRALLAEDGAEGKAEALVLAGSFYLACKPLAPLRLGGGLLLTPGVKRVAQVRDRKY